MTVTGPLGSSGAAPDKQPASVPAAAEAGQPATAQSVDADSTGPAPEAEPKPTVVDAPPVAPGTAPPIPNPAAEPATTTDKPGDTTGAGAASGEATPAGDKTATTTPARRSRVRVRFAHAVRRIPPNPKAAAHAVGVWSRRPSGRLALPALLLFLVVAATGVAGAILVPVTASDRARTIAAGADPSSPDPDTGGLPPTAGGGLPTPTTALTTPPPGLPAPVGRPADVLAGWALQTSNRVGVPAIAIEAYGYAELVLARTTPNCRLTWTTLAAIGLVESNHGRANGASLGPDGKAMPPIIGLPLDGQGGRQRIADTDGGRLDGDPVLDRAVGPMQFIPSTWKLYGVDADNDGVSDPHDIDDAALAAGNYLCANGRNLSTSQDWWNAILSYNDVRPYAQAVFEAANRYGTASRA